MQELEPLLSDQCGEVVQLSHHNLARRPLPKQPTEELRELDQQVRWLYTADNHAFGSSR